MNSQNIATADLYHKSTSAHHIEFIKRRVHSLLGLFLVLFLFEHLLTNSQAALLFGESGSGFVRMVNFLHNLPYLSVIEIILLGVPFVLHGFWGIRYALRGRTNSYNVENNKPTLPYGRNQAYTWQRYTSWILLFGVIFHVIHMRFYRYPLHIREGSASHYFVRLRADPGLKTLSERLGTKIYMPEDLESTMNIGSKAYTKALREQALGSGDAVAVAKDFGTATLLIVRDSFRSITLSILYTIFVLAAVFHAFNGLWTFMITWGVIVRMRSQIFAVNVCICIMVVVGFLGLLAIWGSYFVNFT